MIKKLNELQEDLGKNKIYNVIASSALFSIILLFYILNLTSILEPTVYPLIDRVVYITAFIDKHFTNNFFDSLIVILSTILWLQFSLTSNKKYLFMMAYASFFFSAFYLNLELVLKILVLISIPTILLTIIMNKILKKDIVIIDWKLSMNYIYIFVIVISVLSVVLLASYILFPKISLPSLNFLYYFHLIFSLLSPICLIFISFNYPLKLVFTKLNIKKTGKNIIHRNPIKQKAFVEHKIRVIHLILIIFLAIIISVIPHLGTINKDSSTIGVDTKQYVEILQSIAKSSDYGELLYKVFVLHTGGDRPFTLLFLLVLNFIFFQVSFSSLMENLPLLLGPALVLCTYFLTLRITKDHITSVLASLITIPTHILMGVYAGLYANWLSLFWSYLAILFLFRLLDEPKRIHFIVFSALLVILLFTHVQTWTILMYVLGLFLVITLLKNRREYKNKVLLIFLSVLPSIFVDIVRMLVLNSSGINQEISFAIERDVGIHGISTIWDNLIATTHFTLAGQIGNPVILFLVVYWLYAARTNENYVIFFIVFFSLFALPLLFADQQIQSRFLFEIPFQIPAAIALSTLKDKLGNFFAVAICLWLIVMSVYMAVNFVLVIH